MTAAETNRANYFHLVRSILYRDLILLVRYPVDTAGSLVSLVSIFLLIFFGGQSIAPTRLSDSIEGLMIGYFLWSMSMAAYSGISKTITREAQWGTLERHYLSPFGFGQIIMLKAWSGVVISFLWGAFILLPMMLITGRWLDINVFTVATILVLTLASVVGVGLVFGGLSVLYKKIGNVTDLFQFAIVGLIAAPVIGFNWMQFLPIVQGSAMLQRSMQNGTHLWEFELTPLLILVVTAVVYSILGYIVFQIIHHRARRLGVLGDY